MRAPLDETLRQLSARGPDLFRLEAGMAFAEVVAPNPTERERDRVEKRCVAARSRR